MFSLLLVTTSAQNNSTIFTYFYVEAAGNHATFSLVVTAFDCQEEVT